jgi:hypothetical protein
MCVCVCVCVCVCARARACVHVRHAASPGAAVGVRALPAASAPRSLLFAPLAALASAPVARRPLGSEITAALLPSRPAQTPRSSRGPGRLP